MNSDSLLEPSGNRTVLDTAVVTTQSLAVVGVFYWIPAVLAYAATCIKERRRQAAIVLTALASIVLSARLPWQTWPAFRQSGMWESVMRYFQVRIVGHRSSLIAGRQAVYGVTPHGIVPYSLGLLAFGKLSSIFNHPRIVIASVVRWIPLFAQVLLFGGAIEATDEAISSALAEGASVAVTPGGIAEMYVEATTSVLATRKGFVRHALQRGGLALVPVYVFGATKLFAKIPLPDAVTALSRHLRMSLMVFFGRWGLPIPMPSSLVYAVGQAVLLQPNQPRLIPSQAEVDFVHKAFVRSLERVFEDFKLQAGLAPTASLSIV